MSSLNTVNTRQLRQMIALSLSTNITLFIEGGPGCGKTAITRATLDQLQRNFVYECAAYFSQVTFGLPCPDGDHLRVLRNRAWFEKPDHTLIFDEADKLSPSLQQQMAQVVHERRIGNDKLPSGTNVIMIGNRGKDANGSYGTSNILTSRCARVSFEPSADEIISYASQAGWIPELVTALSLNKGLAYRYEVGKDRFPAPRTWENASTMCQAANSDKSLWPTIMASFVGDDATGKVTAVLEVADKILPTDKIMAAPATAKIPEEHVPMMLQMYTVVHSINSRDVKEALEYILRMPPEISIMGVQALISRFPSSTSAVTTAMRQRGLVTSFHGSVAG